MRRHLPGLILAVTVALGADRAAAQHDGVGVIRHQGLDRHYVLHRPDGPNTPRPLVIALHGLSNAPDWRRGVDWLRAWWAMDAVAEREGFSVVYPAAVSGRWSYSGQRPVPLPGRQDLVDDLGFLDALIDRLVAEGVADPARVHVAGPSRGGLMAWTVACAMSDRVAGAAPLITGMTDGQLPSCRPERAVPVVAMAGTNDRSQPYDGGLYPDYRLLSVPETMEFWRRRHGCSGQEAKLLPHRERADATRVQQVDWTGCAAGPLRLVRVEGGGHNLPSFTPLADTPPWAGPRNRDVETAEEIWRFLRGIVHPAPARR